MLFARQANEVAPKRWIRKADLRIFEDRDAVFRDLSAQRVCEWILILEVATQEEVKGVFGAARHSRFAIIHFRSWLQRIFEQALASVETEEAETVDLQPFAQVIIDERTQEIRRKFKEFMARWNAADNPARTTRKQHSG